MSLLQPAAKMRERLAKFTSLTVCVRNFYSPGAILTSLILGQLAAHGELILVEKEGSTQKEGSEMNISIF